MSDVVRDLIEQCRYHGIGKQVDDLLAAIDAEREAAECWRKTAQDLQKEVADLHKRIAELTAQLQDER